MGIWYEGIMSYNTPGEDEASTLVVGRALIRSFSVVGGASRTINLKKTSDMSISSELEQARQFKNITLFMPPTKNGSDMKTALDLSVAANHKTVFNFSFEIQKVSGNTLLEDLLLVDLHMTMKKPPMIVADNLLMIEAVLPDAYILYENRVGGQDRVKI